MKLRRTQEERSIKLPSDPERNRGVERNGGVGWNDRLKEAAWMITL